MPALHLRDLLHFGVPSLNVLNPPPGASFCPGPAVLSGPSARTDVKLVLELQNADQCLRESRGALSWPPGSRRAAWLVNCSHWLAHFFHKIEWVCVVKMVLMCLTKAVYISKGPAEVFSLAVTVGKPWSTGKRCCYHQIFLKLHYL